MAHCLYLGNQQSHAAKHRQNAIRGEDREGSKRSLQSPHWSLKGGQHGVQERALRGGGQGEVLPQQEGEAGPLVVDVLRSYPAPAWGRRRFLQTTETESRVTAVLPSVWLSSVKSLLDTLLPKHRKHTNLDF